MASDATQAQPPSHARGNSGIPSRPPAQGPVPSRRAGPAYYRARTILLPFLAAYRGAGAAPEATGG